MKDIQLTPHFKLSEFIRSNSASKYHIDNTPSKEIVENLKALCENVLEPLREWYGKPIVISSGYRCPALNRAVGGATTSQHMKGEAADLHLPSIAIGRQWLEHLLEYGLFDQLIWEHDKSGHYWVHVSFKREVCGEQCRTSKNRQTHIPNLLKK